MMGWGRLIAFRPLVPMPDGNSKEHVAEKTADFVARKQKKTEKVYPQSP